MFAINDEMMQVSELVITPTYLVVPRSLDREAFTVSSFPGID